MILLFFFVSLRSCRQVTQPNSHPAPRYRHLCQLDFRHDYRNGTGIRLHILMIILLLYMPYIAHDDIPQDPSSWEMVMLTLHLCARLESFAWISVPRLKFCAWRGGLRCALLGIPSVAFSIGRPVQHLWSKSWIVMDRGGALSHLVPPYKWSFLCIHYR